MVDQQKMRASDRDRQQVVDRLRSALAYPWPIWVVGPYGAVLFAVSAGVTLFRRSRPPAAARSSV